MAKAKIVEYTQRIGSGDECKGTTYDDRKFYLLEILGERPLVIVRWSEQVLVSPLDRQGRDEALGYNFNHISVVGEILEGTRRVVGEVEISDERLACIVQHLETIKPVEQAYDYFGKVLKDNQPGSSHGASRFEF